MTTVKTERICKRTLSFLFAAILAVNFSYIGCQLSCQAASNEVIALNNAGVGALNSGNFKLAIDKFEAAIKLDPSYQIARDNLAIAYNNYGLKLQSSPKEAIKQFHKALLINPSNNTTISNLDGIIQMMGKNPSSFKDRVALGNEARLAGDFAGAIVEYRAAVNIKPDAQIYGKLGDVLRVRDDNEAAIEAFKKGVATKPSAELYVKLGQAYQANKDLSDAIGAYGKALEQNPDDPDVLDALVTGWEQALKENPTAPANHIGLGQAFQYRGDFDQAAAEYKQALFFDKNNQTAQRLLGELAKAKGDYEIKKHVNAGVDLQQRKLYDQAIEEYKKALEADPSSAAIWVNIGTAYQAKEAYSNAIQAYNKALAIEPGNANAKEGIKSATAQKEEKDITASEKQAAELFKLGKYDEAIATYKELLVKKPQDPAVHFSLGATLQAAKQIDAAIAQYRQAVSMDGKNKDYKDALESAYDLKVEPIVQDALKKQKAKDYPSAIALWQQVLNYKPKNVDVWANLAAAYYSREDYAKAKETYEKLLKLDPKGQAENIYLIAAIDENFGQGTQALSTYQQYLAKNPGGRYAAAAKERIAKLTNNPNDTIKIKSEKELLAIKQAAQSYDKAVAAQQAKNWVEAQAEYEKAIQLQPKEDAYAYGLGTMFQEKGDIDLAINWYKNAAQLDPANKDYPQVIAAAYDDKAAPVIDQAVKLQTSGNAEEAIPIYKKALEIVPDNGAVWTNLATAYQNTDNFQGARESYAKGLALDPKGQVSNLYFMAAIDENFNQGTKALDEYKQYLQKDPGGKYIAAAQERVKSLTANPNATNKLQTRENVQTARAAAEAFDQAIKLQEASQFDGALPLYQKAAELQPEEAAYAYGLGTLYQAKEDFGNAITWYEKAISLDPKNQDYPAVLQQAKALKAAPLMDGAIKLQQDGQYQDAIDLYRQALNVLPDNAGGWTNLASCYQASDQWAQAREMYKKAISIDAKGQVDNWFFVAVMDETLNQGAQALQDYQKYVASGGSQYAVQAKERIQALTANPNDVQKLQTQDQAKATADAAGAYDDAIKLQEAGKYDEAIAEYQKAVQAQPNEAAYAYGLGTAYQGKGDYDSAIEWYKKASALDPKNETYKKLTGDAYQLKAAPILDEAIKDHTAGEYQKAVGLYQQALAITPGNANAWTNLGAAYQAMDDFVHAREAFSKGVNLDPQKEASDWYFIAAIDENFNQGAKALSEYKKYVQADPQGQYVDLARQRIQALTANPNDVQKLVTAAQQKQSVEADDAFNEAVKLQEGQQYDQAIEQYKKALQILPDNASYWYSMATCYQAMDNNDEALKGYARAAQLDPGNASYKQYADQLKQAKAAPLLEEAYKKQTTKRADGSYDLAGAIQNYEQALKLWDDATTRLNLGTAYQNNNQNDKALEQYKKSLALDPKQCDAYYYIGTVYEAMSKPKLAIGQYRKCVTCNPAGGSVPASKERIKILAGG